MGHNGEGQLGNGTTTGSVSPFPVGMALANVISSGSYALHTLAVGLPLLITSQPASQWEVVGGNVTFTVTASGEEPLTYQWYFNGSVISGATAANYTLTGVTTNNAGDYTVAVITPIGSVTSSVATLMVGYAPTITAQPASQAVAVGGTVNLSVTATGDAPLTYQWLKDGRMVMGATNSALTLAGAGVTNLGIYYVVVTNAYGFIISLPVTVTVGDPQLLAWGGNGYGQLGDGTTNQQNSPESVAGNVVTAAAGGDHSLFVKSDGTLWAMGYNGDGELGDGTTINRSNAVSVAGDVVSVAAGAWYSLYLTSDGTLWDMGDNGIGQLGDGTTTGHHSPVAVVGGSNVVAVVAGESHSLFLKSDGTLWAMGENGFGALGDGTTSDRHSPVSVASHVVAMAAGRWHSLYLKSDGTLWAMGYNGDGELGDGTTINRSNAVSVASHVVSVAAGAWYSLYLTSDGTLWAMGDNDYGQLGDGTTTSQSLPKPVASSVVAMAAGYTHSLYLKSDGTLWAMGENGFGALGDGTTTLRTSPVAVRRHVPGQCHFRQYGPSHPGGWCLDGASDHRPARQSDGVGGQ